MMSRNQIQVICLIISLICLSSADKIETKRTFQSFFDAIHDPDQEWIFMNDGGYLGTMKFEKYGAITGYDNNNQRFWMIEKGMLTFLRGDKVTTCRFVDVILDSFGKWHAQGLYVGHNDVKGWRHYIVQK